MKRGRRTLLVALLLAAFGAYLAFDAWRGGSLWRYRLVGYVAGAALMVPLGSRLLLGGARGSWLWRRVLFVSAPLLVLLLLAEGAVRLFGAPPERPARLLDDPRLGHVLAPGTAGTDARGWRNQAALETADVLFVGDSQTYGFGVEIDETFAAHSETAGRRCYQMANGSYGPVQYVELVRRGLSLQPEVVVVTLYYGNDLVDAPDYTGLEGAEALRAGEQGPRIRANPEPDSSEPPNLTMTLVDGVLSHSRLLNRAAEVVKSRLQGGALDQTPASVPFAHETAATIWQPQYRRRALRAASANVRDGVAITRRCLEHIAELCGDAGARLVVAVLPTKERCYAAWLGERAPALSGLAADEAAAHRAIFAEPIAAGVQVVELLPALVAAMEGGRMPWFASGDGHIASEGHRVVAEALRPFL